LNTIKWSDEVYRIFKLTPQSFEATYDAFLQRVHPNDRESVVNSVNNALYNNQNYNIEHRVILPNGSESYVHH